MAEWFVQVDGKRYGPFDSAKLVKLAQAGKVKPDDMVKKGHDGDWTPARRVRRLFDPEAQANYRSSQSSSSSKRRESKGGSGTSSKRGAAPSGERNAKSNSKRPRTRSAQTAPVEPLFDLAEEVAAGVVSVDPLAPPPALASVPTPRARRRFDPRRNIGYTLAKASWQMPIVTIGIVGFAIVYGFATKGAPSPTAYFCFGLAFWASVIVGFLSGPIALCLIPRYGSEYILPHAVVGTCIHLTILVLAGMAIKRVYDRVQSIQADAEVRVERDVETTEPPATSRVPHVEGRDTRNSFSPPAAVKNPFAPPAAAENPFQPESGSDNSVESSDTSENPFEPGGESENPFEPKDEPGDPSEPAAASENPFEPADAENPFE